MLLWHGVMRSYRSFAPLWPLLAQRWHLHLADHRGHGHAPWGGPYLVRDYAADAEACLNDLGEPAVLYGHSLGALTAAWCAASLPHLARAVILEDPPPPSFLANPDATPYGRVFREFERVARNKEATIPQATAALQALGLPRDPASLRLSARMLLDLDPEVLPPLIQGRWLEGVDFPSVLRRIQCPVLLLQADVAAGGMLSDPEADAMRACLSDVTLARLPGVGHQAHWLATADLARHLLAFLESLA